MDATDRKLLGLLADDATIAYRDLVQAGPNPPLLPHPRMTLRAFVLLPLQAIAPDWRHPVSVRTVAELIAELPAGQEIRLL